MKFVSRKILNYGAVALLLVGLVDCSLLDKGKRASASKQEYLRQGKASLEKGKYKEAWIDLRNALQLDPRDPEVHFQLALTYAKMNDQASAFREVEQTVQLDPANLRAQLMLGNYYLVAAANDRSYFERALRVADAILAKQPNNLDAYVLRGNAHAGLSSYDKALDELQQVLEKDPKRLPVYISLATIRVAQKDLDAAEATFKQALKFSDKSPVAIMTLANFYLLRRHNPEEAEKHLRKAYDLYPKDPRTAFSLAMFYMFRKRPDQAEAVLVDAAKRDAGNPEPKRALALFYVANGRAEQGRQILRDLVKANPDDALSRQRLASLLIDDKSMAEARSHIETLLKKNSSDSEAHLLRGKLSLKEGKIDEAIQALNTAQQLNPSSAFTYYYLGHAYYTRGETAQAESAFSEALRLDSHMLIARVGLAKTHLSTRQYDTALGEAFAVLQIQPTNVDALLVQGEGLLLTGRLPPAREVYLKAIALDPSNPAAYHRLGVVYYQEKEYDKALNKFEEALALNPNLVDAINDIIAIYVEQGKDPEALERINKQINMASVKAPLYELQGKLYYRMNRAGEAEVSFRKALELDKNLFSSYFQLAQLLVVNGKGPESAIRPLDNALKVDPGLSFAYALKGLIYDHYRDRENAKVNYRKALALAPDLAVAANNLAAIYAESGRSEDLDQAQTLAQRARQVMPDNVPVADTLGWIYYKRMNYPMAVDQLEFSVSKEPKNPLYCYHLGMAYYKMDRRHDAKKTLQTALALNRPFAGIEEARQTLRDLR